MKTIEIERIEETPLHILGIVRVDGVVVGITLENPWKDNQRNISCIPAGEYTAVKHTSPKFGDTYHINNVPGRSEIIFHAGNTTSDTAGCVLLGLGFGGNNKSGMRVITNSREAVSAFIARMAGAKEARVIVKSAKTEEAA